MHARLFHEMDVRNNNIKTISKVSMPFYEPPPRKTSAEIINEARLAISGENYVFLFRCFAEFAFQNPKWLTIRSFQLLLNRCKRNDRSPQERRRGSFLGKMVRRNDLPALSGKYSTKGEIVKY